MSDLAERLRISADSCEYTARSSLLNEAADAIDDLVGALKKIAYGSGEWLVPPEKIAREALGMVPAPEKE